MRKRPASQTANASGRDSHQITPRHEEARFIYPNRPPHKTFFAPNLCPVHVKQLRPPAQLFRRLSTSCRRTNTLCRSLSTRCRRVSTQCICPTTLLTHAAILCTSLDILCSSPDTFHILNTILCTQPAMLSSDVPTRCSRAVKLRSPPPHLLSPPDKAISHPATLLTARPRLQIPHQPLESLPVRVMILPITTVPYVESECLRGLRAICYIWRTLAKQATRVSG